MGFFNAFKNIVLGKPVFTTPQQQKQAEHLAHGGTVPPPGPKILPQMVVERVNVQANGHELEVEAIVQNNGAHELLLDKIELLGKTVYLNGVHVSPGEEHEFTAYNGPRPNNTYNGQCLLYYKDESGDYFASQHNIEFNQLPDGTYSINYIRFQNVRDV